MKRFLYFYRLRRAILAIRAWRPPPGVEVRLVLRPDRPALQVVLTDGEGYLSMGGPWLSLTRSVVRAKLDALARVLAARGGRRDDPDEPDDDDEPSDAVTAAGRHFESVMADMARDRRRIVRAREVQEEDRSC